MKKSKKFIIDLYNSIFTKPKVKSKFRRLEQNEKSGALNWGEGEKPFKDGPEEEGEVKPFHLNDDEKKKVRTYEPPISYGEPFFKNRFKIEFPGIPGYYFNSYNYMGTNKHSKKSLFSTKVITEDYSSFKILLLFPSDGFDICEKMKELELNPKVGDIVIDLLDPTGMTVKQIVIPDCEITEIKAFRELDYGVFQGKGNEVLYGEIIVKHKQRKLI